MPVRKCGLNEGVVLRLPGPDGVPVLCRVIVSRVGCQPKLMVDAPEGVKIEPVTLRPEVKELQRQNKYLRRRMGKRPA